MASFQPADIGALVATGQPNVSPDGRSIAYTVTTIDAEANEYNRQIWLVAADGSSAPRPLTAGEHRDGLPKWSRQGDRIAFVSHRRDDGCEIYVLPLTGGEPQKLLEWPEEVIDLQWSPDGSTVAFASRARDEDVYGKDKDRDRPPRRIDVLRFRLDNEGFTIDRRTQVFVVPSDGGDAIAITSGPFDHGGIAWAPDGTRIAFAGSRHENWDFDFATDLFTAAADGSEASEPVQLTKTGAGYSRPSFSPDGTALAFMVEDVEVMPSHAQVGVLDLATGTQRLLTESLDRNCAPYPGAREPVWMGGDLLFAVEDDGNSHVYAVAADGSSAPRLLVGGECAVQSYDWAGGTLAFCAGSPISPSDVHIAVEGAAPRRVSEHATAFTMRFELAAPQRFQATSTGGAVVSAWVIPPLGAEPGRKYPALLNVHGGPFTQYKNDLFDEFQLQAAAGFAVVYCNPRGSSGYSQAWGRAIRGTKSAELPGSGWGGVDADDVVAVIDEAARQFDFIDPERLGMLGGSYGGYMATWLAGHTDRFKAYCSERAVNNFAALEYSSDIAGAFRFEVGVSHLDDPEGWLERSPATYVREIKAPVLILHSENDLRCPIGQAEELFVALRMLGKPVEYWRFPGESHELSRSGSPFHRIRRAEIILDFFQRHL